MEETTSLYTLYMQGKTTQCEPTHHEQVFSTKHVIGAKPTGLFSHR